MAGAQHLSLHVVTCAAVLWLTIIVAAPLRGDEPPGPTQPGQPASIEPDQRGEELGKRLVHKAVTDSEEDLMGSVIRLMNDASRKLEVEFEAGEETQAVQRRIMQGLDDAIKEAAARRRMRSSQEKSATTGDMRRRPADKKRSEKASREAGKDRTQEPSAKNTLPEPASADLGKEAGRLGEARRAWGALPLREREEVIQGAGEEYLERYRGWIERYYRALQEAGE